MTAGVAFSEEVIVASVSKEAEKDTGGDKSIIIGKLNTPAFACLRGNYDAMAKKIKKYDLIISKYNKKYDVSIALIKAVITAESCMNPNAESHKGAQGLMQLMPLTAKHYGVTDRLDPDENIKAGTQYLKFLLKYFNEDLLDAIAAYNAGQGAVYKHNGIPPFKETKQYVYRVVALYKFYSSYDALLMD